MTMSNYFFLLCSFLLYPLLSISLIKFKNDLYHISGWFEKLQLGPKKRLIILSTIKMPTLW